MHAMELLKSHGLPFGVSTCYTSANVDAVSSEEYFDHLIECGAYFAWFFHYMPVGNDAAADLLPTPEQRIKSVRQRPQIPCHKISLHYGLPRTMQSM